MDGVILGDKPFVDINLDYYSTLDEKLSAKENWIYVDDISGGMNNVIFTCLENKPEVTLSISCKVVH
ncbi:MAG: hypothetical protein E7270_01170 [Lachnospiraceae bacterium]|nr:hypothetical protein [Lachnospiraceae bacterium]